MRRALILVCLVLTISKASAQKFWLLTYSFPQGYKNCIELYNDSSILVGQNDGVWFTENEGIDWVKVLNAKSIQKLYKSKAGRVFAGGYGKIYFTDNLISWDSVNINQPHFISGFTENNHGIYASTFSFDINVGYNGAGVFKSINNGFDWTLQNNGILETPSVQHIKADKNGRLYISVANSNVSPNAGLYISNNNAETWQHVPIEIDGKNVIPGNIKIEFFTALNIINNDSLLISFEGIAVNQLVRLNLIKPLSEVSASSLWRPVTVINKNYWWLDRPIGETITVKEHQWYSSLAGSINVGGTLFSSDDGHSWWKHSQGLGLDYTGMFNQQFFVKNSKSKVFMIQNGDERVYWTDTSALTSVDLNKQKLELLVYPNPSKTSSTFFVDTKNKEEKIIELYTMEGRLVYSTTSTQEIIPLQIESAGMYVLIMKTSNGFNSQKVIVENY